MTAWRSVGVLLCLAAMLAVCGASETIIIPKVRVAPEDRRFTSAIIEEVIANTTAAMRDKDLATLFENCYPNTLDTTVMRAEQGDSFVITGDIEAMWLRDSTYQVHSYIPYAGQDKKLRTFLEGLVLRQLRSIVMDPYANAFNDHANGAGWQEDQRKPPMQPSVFEGKYELDSLNAVIGLNHGLVAAIAGDVSFLKHEVSLWITAMNKILDTMEDMSVSSASEHGDSPYTFHRMYENGVIERYPHATMAAGTGLIRSAFRPSDDMTVYDYLMPSNVQSLVALENLPKLCRLMTAAYPMSEKAFDRISSRAQYIRSNVEKAFQKAVKEHIVLPFEMDGYGHTLLMDDGNVPSLLSLPFLGMKVANYNATRNYILSERNPFYFSGVAAKGIGSPHTGKDYIWPLALIMQAWTSDNDTEITEVLETLKRSANVTGFMHESFHKDDVSRYTRDWFAWANSFFGGLILHLAKEKPHLIF